MATSSQIRDIEILNNRCLGNGTTTYNRITLLSGMVVYVNSDGTIYNGTPDLTGFTDCVTTPASIDYTALLTDIRDSLAGVDGAESVIDKLSELILVSENTSLSVADIRNILSQSYAELTQIANNTYLTELKIIEANALLDTIIANELNQLKPFSIAVGCSDAGAVYYRSYFVVNESNETVISNTIEYCTDLSANVWSTTQPAGFTATPCSIGILPYIYTATNALPITIPKDAVSFTIANIGDNGTGLNAQDVTINGGINNGAGGVLPAGLGLVDFSVNGSEQKFAMPSDAVVLPSGNNVVVVTYNLQS
jgi:hypothetical protein